MGYGFILYPATAGSSARSFEITFTGSSGWGGSWLCSPFWICGIIRLTHLVKINLSDRVDRVVWVGYGIGVDLVIGGQIRKGRSRFWTSKTTQGNQIQPEQQYPGSSNTTENGSEEIGVALMIKTNAAGSRNRGMLLDTLLKKIKRELTTTNRCGTIKESRRENECKVIEGD